MNWLNIFKRRHEHSLRKVAHWCDKDCSIVIVEYKCTACDHEAFDFIYFDDEHCKVLKRVPVEVSAIDAPKLVKCGEQICDKQKTTNKASENIRGRRITDHAEGGTKAPKKEKRGTKKAKAD